MRPSREAGDSKERNNGPEQKPNGGSAGKHRDRGQQACRRCRKSHQVEPGDNKSSSKRAGGGLGHIGGQRPYQGPATPSNKTRAGGLERGVGNRESAGNIRMAALLHASHNHLASSGVRAEAEDGRTGQ
jgi:hypothetical protein